MQRRPPDPRDDVDRLFARLHHVEPPADLTRRIMRALPSQVPVATAAPAPPVAQPRLSDRQWQGVAGIATVFLLIMSVRLGMLLEDSGAFSIFGDMFSNFGDFVSAPGDYLTPLMAELPWFDISLGVLALVVFWVSSSTSVERLRGKR